MNIKNKYLNLLFFLPSILWMALITYLSSRSQIPDMQQFFQHADKVAHFSVYFILGILLLIGLKINLKISNFLYSILTISIGFSFAIIDEYHQSFVPNRVPDLYDFIADILGIIISLFFYKQINLMEKLILKKLNRK